MNPKRDSRRASPSAAPILPAARTLLGRGWPTAALVCWLPLVKWAFPTGVARTALFYGGGLLLSSAAVVLGGGWPRARPLFRAPGTGLAAALAGFAALMALSALLLSFSWLPALLPPPLPELIAFFDPRPVFASLSGGGHEFPAGKAIGWAAGAIAEEWIFRVALLWRWVATEDKTEDKTENRAEIHAGAPGENAVRNTMRNPAENPAQNAMPRRADTLPRKGLKLVMVSAYFAALHWPGSIAQLAAAFLGAMAAGGLLLRWRNFHLISALHVLFNWKALS